MSDGDSYGNGYNDGRSGEYNDYYYGSSYQGSAYRGRGRGGSSYRGRGSSYYDGYSSHGGRGGKYYDSYSSYYGGGGRASRGGRGSGHDTYEAEPEGDDLGRPDGHDTYRGSGYRGNNYMEDYRGSYRGSYRGRGNYHHQPHHSKEAPPHSDTASTPKSAAREPAKPAPKAHNNPWIDTLGIKDDATADTLESRYNVLQAVNKDMAELQAARARLERASASLENSAAREELHVQITNEKLDEFTYM